MRRNYDWNKLDARWQFDGVDTLIDRKWDCRYSVTDMEDGAAVRGRIGLNVPAALDQLTKCRIPAPELRPRDEYDWSRLEGSGWEYPGGSSDHIASERWNYYYTTGFLAFRLHGIATHPDETLRVHQDAHALVAKCRRDWRDEVMGAAPIPGEWGSGELNSFTDVVVVHPLPGKMKLTCNPHRRMELDGDADLVGCLRLSIVIERLKKLGWSEA